MTDDRRDTELAEVARGLSASVTALTGQVERLRTRIRRSEVRTLVLAGSLILDVVLTVVIAVIGINVTTVSECQERKNEAFATAIAQRDAAQAELLETRRDPGITQEERGQSFTRYLTRLAESDPIPTEVCS